MDVTKDTFEAQVLQSPVPVLVDFWAPWCAPCRVLGPVLERLESQAKGLWRLCKVDTEAEPQLAMEYQISSIPAVKLFHQGKVIAEFVGALPESQLARWLATHIPSPGQNYLEDAREALASGERPKAKRLLESALAMDENNYDIRVPLAELLWPEARERALGLIQGIPTNHPLLEHETDLKWLDALWEDAADLDHDAKVWPQFAAGVAALRDADYTGALDNWINVLKRDRKFGDDAARRACVALFRWLGENHPITQQQRRQFASALF